MYFVANEYFACGAPSCEVDEGESERIAAVGCYALPRLISLLFFAPGSAAGTNLRTRVWEMRSLHGLVQQSD